MPSEMLALEIAGAPIAVSSANPVPVTLSASGARANISSQFTTITASTNETTVATAVAATYLDVYGVIVENTSATACKVTFKNSTAGTTMFEIYVPAGDTRGFMLPPGSGFKQAAVNNNWTATCGTSVSSIVISVLFTKST
jgi:hypothetical protein